MQPKNAPVPIEDFLSMKNDGENKLTAKDLARMAGVTPAVITRARQAKDRKFMVEPINSKRVQLWEYTGSPWRRVVTKDTPPKKAVQS